MRKEIDRTSAPTARRLAGLAAAAALAALLAIVLSCGMKGRLQPRDHLETDDERLPPKWGQPTPDPFGSQLGVDGLIEKAGEPGRIKSLDLSPEPLPELTPPDPEATPAPEGP